MIALGLSTNQAQELLVKYGRNEIVVENRKTAFSIIISQFRSFLVLILFLAAIVSFLLSDPYDGLFIIAIIIINSLLGFIQEYRAERAIAELKKLASSQTIVVRDGQTSEIDSRLLVPGDVFTIEEGDKIPADAKLLEAVNLEVNEASLTGESLPVYKKEGEEEHEGIFLGTIVVAGRGMAIVEATAMQTRFGKIAKSLSEITEAPTPLTRQLALLGRQLASIAIVASMLLFLVGFFRVEKASDQLNLFLTAVSLAVAAVPEGLPVVLTITLAVGMHRLAKSRAIARKMAAIETLGAATIIATDKTGTITKNQMRVSQLYVNGENHEVIRGGLDMGNRDLLELLRIGATANTASLVFRHDHESFDIIGDPTEGALLLAAHELGLEGEDIKKEGALLDEFSFDTKRKTMSVLWKSGNAGFVYVKGAPEAILDRSTRVLFEGEELPLTDTQRRRIEEAFQEEAKRGFRIIAMAKKEVRSDPSTRLGAEKLEVRSLTRDEVESELTFVGFAALSDPPRPEVEEAARVAESAGIRTVIITGDNELTANAIAQEVGLIKEAEDILTGLQLDELSDDELLKVLPNVRIFARTTPEHKFRIVKAYQRLGHIVAVTGDGVNDALALKQANVGIAMGIAGTDVAKEAADIIVTDDNYASVVKAVEEGRVIFDNIVKSVTYLASGNLGEILTIFLAVLFGPVFGFPTIPLFPVQILWINLVTDGLPALALAVDPREPLIMKRRPRDAGTAILDLTTIRFILISGIGIALAVLVLFGLSLSVLSDGQARTIAFTTLILLHMSIAFLVRKNHSMFSNKFLVLSVVIVVFLQILIMTIPSLQHIFKLEPLW